MGKKFISGGQSPERATGEVAGTWGPLGIPRVSEHHSLATLSLSIFLVGFPSPYPSRSAWEEMTVLCLVPKSCPRDVDAQRNN